jgi:WD40 repeat protein
LDPGVSPLTEFAADLRRLREKAGSPPYRELAGRAHYSWSTLADAAAGRRLPSLPVTLAYVSACGADPAEWETRWRELAMVLAGPPANDSDRSNGDEDCPYVGLRAFQAEDAEMFFGREQLTGELVSRVRAGRFLAVFGPSGSGKSSLLRAGLVPRIRAENRGPVVLLNPGPHPLEECAAHLAAQANTSASALHRDLTDDPRALHLTVLRILHDQPADADLLLVVDQFEEIFTLCADPAERTAFIDALLTAARAGNARTRVVLGVRADFYPHCSEYPSLVDGLRDAQLLVGPMSTDELRRAVSLPAARAGCTVEGALLARVVADAGGQANKALPLVSHALRQAWSHRRGNTLTVAGYDAVGGVEHALARTAEDVFTALTPEQQRLVRSVFLRLVALGDRTEDTKRRLYRRELGTDPDITPVTERLVQARLVTIDGDSLEIAHEALIHRWPRLREWLSADRDVLLTHRQLTEATRNWERLDRDAAALYRGTPLDRALGLLGSDVVTLTAPELDFLHASARARDLEAVRARRRIRRLRQLITAAMAFALLATAAAAVAAQQWSVATRQRDDAVFNQVLSEADRLRQSDPSLSAELDLVAAKLRPADQGVYTRLISTANAPLATPLAGHTGNVYLTSFSPDGRTLATASADGTARLWDVHDPTRPTQLGRPLYGHTGWLSSAVFSPNGHILATAGADGTVELWNVADPAHPVRLRPSLSGQDGSNYLVSFSPDGHILATADEDHTVRLWDITDPTHPAALGQPLAGAAGPVRSVAFSPDGHVLAAGGDDATVLLWDVSDPLHPARVGQPLTGHTAIVHSVAFSPDGRTLASGSQDGTVRLWDVTQPTNPTPLGQPLTGYAGAVWSVAFSPDGQTLATASADSTARLWNVADLRQPRQLGPALAGSGGDLYAVAFSPDGRGLATGSADGVTRLWSLPTALLTGHQGAVTSTAFARNSNLIATGADDNTVRLWNVTQPAGPVPVARLPAAPGYLSSCGACRDDVQFSPDGRVLAAVSYDQMLRLWNVDDPSRPTPATPPIPLNTRYVASLAFSPDGRTLATGYDDDTEQLWDVTDDTHPVPLARLTGHQDNINSVAFAPTGHILATAGADRTIRLWDVTDLRHPTMSSTLVGHTNAVVSVAFSPDGHLLASGGADQTVRLWNVTDPAHPTPTATPLAGHAESVSSVAFSPDGHLLASASTDQTVRLWNVADPTNPTSLGEPITTFAGAGYALAFDADSDVLAFADGADTLRLLDLNADHAIHRICATTRGTLTPQQWAVHLPGLPYQPPCGTTQ